MGVKSKKGIICLCLATPLNNLGYTHKRTHTPKLTHTHECTTTNTHTHTSTHTHTHTSTHTHTHTHTHCTACRHRISASSLMHRSQTDSSSAHHSAILQRGVCMHACVYSVLCACSFSVCVSGSCVGGQCVVCKATAKGSWTSLPGSCLVLSSSFT